MNSLAFMVQNAAAAVVDIVMTKIVELMEIILFAKGEFQVLYKIETKIGQIF